MKTGIRIGLLLILLGMLQVIVQQISAQSGNITGDVKRFVKL